MIVDSEFRKGLEPILCELNTYLFKALRDKTLDDVEEVYKFVVETVCHAKIDIFFNPQLIGLSDD